MNIKKYDCRPHCGWTKPMKLKLLALALTACLFLWKNAEAQVSTVVEVSPDDPVCQTLGACQLSPYVSEKAGSFAIDFAGNLNQGESWNQTEGMLLGAQTFGFQQFSANQGARQNLLPLLCDDVFPFPDRGGGFLCKRSDIPPRQVVILIPPSETQKLPDGCTARRGGECGEILSLDGDQVFPTFWRTIANGDRGHFDVPTSTEGLGELFSVIFRYPRTDGTSGCIVIDKQGTERVD